MLVQWTVVVDEGTRPFGPGISPDQRRPLAFSIGEDVTLQISLIDSQGGAVALGSGDFLQLDTRTGARPQRQLFTARSVATSEGRQKISLAADATKTLLPQRGEFDLWLVRGGKRAQLIPISEFSLTPGALGVNYL